MTESKVLLEIIVEMRKKGGVVLTINNTYYSGKGQRKELTWNYSFRNT